MDPDQAQDEPSTFRGRTVSDLAHMFESKVREKVRSSPYLRHYEKFNAAKFSAEKHPTPQVKSMTMPIKIPNNFDEQRHLSFDGKEASGVYSEPNVKVSSVAIKHRMESKAFVYQSSLESASQQQVAVLVNEPEEPIDSSNVLGANSFKVISNHRRSKSFTNGIQRFLKREKRRGSLDTRDTDKLRQNEDLGNDFEEVFAKNDKRAPRWKAGRERQASAATVTPKVSLSKRRSRSDNDDSTEGSDAIKKEMKKKSSKFRGFFRAISLNNIGEARKTAALPHENWCANCREDMPTRKKVLSLERFNTLKDERDLLRNERDRAVEEWSEAASRWERMLDDMDSLMNELVQVKNDRDEKAAEIGELINEYEDELKIRESENDRLHADFAVMEDNLAVAKKERIEALTEYDELLKQNYDLTKEMERFEDMCIELRSCVAVNEQDVASLKHQLDNLQEERDHALELWNSSVEERKKLHKEMASLIQARDESLRKAFQQAEEINKIKEERDFLKRMLDSKRVNGHFDLIDSVRLSHGSPLHHENNDISSHRNHVQDSSETKEFAVSNTEDSVSEFEELAVSLERLDSKYGIRIDTAVDEPRIMVVHVGAHAASTSNIRKYDRIISINGVSVVRADKKMTEKMIRDCPGRLTMVLRRETSAEKFEKTKDIEFALPKTSYRKGQRDLGVTVKVQVLSIDERSPIAGKDMIEHGDLINKINTQDISKVFEAVLYKIAKKHGGKITMRVQKKNHTPRSNNDVISSSKKGTKVSDPESSNGHKSHGMVSTSSTASTLSLSSMTSEKTFTSAYTYDAESLFNGSLTPSIVVCPCDENEDDAASIQKTKDPPSSIPSENGSADEKNEHKKSEQEQLINDQEQEEITLNLQQARPNGHIKLAKRHSDVRSLRSLKIASSAKSNKQALRRVRSDAVDRRASPKAELSKNLLFAVEEDETDSERRENSWLLPSPARTPTENRRGNDAVSVFATLPRQKRKTVNEADCNKRTTHRVLRLEKVSSQPLGFEVCGGNKVGIFVKDIKDGSMAAVGGMKVGDRILYINSFDLHCATLDYATRIIFKSQRLTHFRIEVKFEEKFKDILKEGSQDSLYVRTLRSSDCNKEGWLQFCVGEILHVTNTLANYNKQKRNSWQWSAEKVSRNSAGQRGFVPRLESFEETEEQPPEQPHSEIEGSPDKSATFDNRRRRRRSASDVRKWLLRKPSMSKKKKDKEIKPAVVAVGEQGPYYEILWDN